MADPNDDVPEYWKDDEETKYGEVGLERGQLDDSRLRQSRLGAQLLAQSEGRGPTAAIDQLGAATRENVRRGYGLAQARQSQGMSQTAARRSAVDARDAAIGVGANQASQLAKMQQLQGQDELQGHYDRTRDSDIQESTVDLDARTRAKIAQNDFESRKRAVAMQIAADEKKAQMASTQQYAMGLGSIFSFAEGGRVGSRKLVSEDENSFELESSDGKRFRVAKKGLGERTTSMIKGYSEGGRTDFLPPAEPAVFLQPQQTTTYDQLAAQYADPTAGGMSVQPPPSEVSMADQLFSAKKGGVDVMGPTQPVDWTGIGEDLRKLNAAKKPGIDRPLTPEEAAAERAQAAPAEAPAPMPQAPTLPGVAGPLQPIQAPLRVPQLKDTTSTKEYEAAIEKRREAEAEAVRVAEAKAAQEAEVQSRLLQNWNDAKRHHDEKRAALDSRGERLRMDAEDSKIDPGKYFADRGTAGRIMANIAIALGSFGQALSAKGGMNVQNSVLAQIDKAIDRDIDAQKANMAQKNNLLKMHMDDLGSFEAAYAATKADLMSFAKVDLDRLTAAAKGAEAKARGQAFSATLDAEVAGKREEAAKLSAQTKYTNDVNRYNAELARRQAMAAGAPKLDKEVAAEVREFDTRYETMNVEMANLIKQIREKGTYEVFGPENKLFDQRIESIAVDYAKMVDPKSVARESEVESAKRMLAEKSIAKDSNASTIKSLENFRRMVNSRRQAFYRARGLPVPPTQKGE